MPIPTYTPGYPPDGSSLGQTKSTIRNNLDGTFETVAIDHINNNGQPGSQPAGYHTVIHQVTQTSVSTVAGYNQVFSGVPGTLIVNGVTTPDIPSNGDTQLYALSGAGVLSQLSGNSLASAGYSWTGGILIQWGSGTTGTPVTFPKSFPNNIFNIQVTAKSTSVKSAPAAVSPSTSGFSCGNNDGQTFNFYWLAIGN